LLRNQFLRLLDQLFPHPLEPAGLSVAQHVEPTGLKGDAMTRIAILLLMWALAGGTWAHDDFGQPGDPKKVARTVRIGMADTMRYTPSELTVRRGETIKFVVRNNGKVDHEMVLGTLQVL
jgi:plastocyanin